MITQRTRSGGAAKAAAIAGNAMFIMESSETTSAPAAATHRDIPRMMTRHARSARLGRPRGRRAAGLADRRSGRLRHRDHHAAARRVGARPARGGVPATALGTAIYVGASSEWLGRFIGLFLIASVPLRRILATDFFRMRLRYFPVLGAVVGLISGLIVTTGPLNTPFFLSYGLRRSAYVGTEAVCAMVMHLARGVTLARYALLTWEAAAVGVLLGATMFAGSWVGRRLLDRMSDRVFLAIIEVLLVVMGLHSLLFPR